MPCRSQQRSRVRGNEAPYTPPGVEESVFRKALDELREQLGPDHVVLNDQPLQDGW